MDSNFAPEARVGADIGVAIGAETCNSTGFTSKTCSGLSLSFGSLDDSEPRGRCSHKPLACTPTHLVYVPTSRSIVVACHTSSDNRKASSHHGDTAANSGATPAPCGGTEQAVSPSTAASSYSASSLRIFDADTLEERQSTSPVSLLPGVRVTGMALLPGLGGPLGATAPSHPSCPNPRSAPTMAAAVGGDVVAVACCVSTAETEERLRWREGARAESVTTVVAAFEVVARGNDGGAVSDEAGAHFHTTGGIDGSSCEGRDDTGLAALAASPAMAGACFGLETLGKRFLAGSSDDRIIILGWEGCEQQGIR